MRKVWIYLLWIIIPSSINIYTMSGEMWDDIELVHEKIEKKTGDNPNEWRRKDSCYNIRYNEEGVFYITISYDKKLNVEYSNLHYFYNVVNNAFDLMQLKNPDAIINVSVATDQPLLIINTLQEDPYYYDSKQDDYIWTFDLNSLKKGIIKKDSIFCKFCRSCFHAGGKWLFTKSNERDDFYNGYADTDIYISSNDDLSDSVKIATKFSIKSVSADGRYILAEKNGVSPERACVIIDSKKRKYQIILGRDYNSMDPFYSKEKTKFGFYDNDNIIYIDMPHKFPFNAMDSYYPYVDSSFLKKHQK